MIEDQINEPTVKEALGESDPKKAFEELLKRRNAFFAKKMRKGWF